MIGMLIEYRSGQQRENGKGIVLDSVLGPYHIEADQYGGKEMDFVLTYYLVKDLYGQILHILPSDIVSVEQNSKVAQYFKKEAS